MPWGWERANTAFFCPRKKTLVKPWLYYIYQEYSKFYSCWTGIKTASTPACTIKIGDVFYLSSPELSTHSLDDALFETAVCLGWSATRCPPVVCHSQLIPLYVTISGIWYLRTWKAEPCCGGPQALDVGNTQNTITFPLEEEGRNPGFRRIVQSMKS